GLETHPTAFGLSVVFRLPENNIAFTAWLASCPPCNISVVLVAWKPTLRRLVYQSFSGCLNDLLRHNARLKTLR
ncbi:MAG: hypothetical protein IJV56_06270, partial [Neisseriaceae bacterium]|nr:hypothetical protein [Neisseriaceae bacterium]